MEHFSSNIPRRTSTKRIVKCSSATIAQFAQNAPNPLQTRAIHPFSITRGLPSYRDATLVMEGVRLDPFILRIIILPLCEHSKWFL